MKPETLRSPGAGAKPAEDRSPCSRVPHRRPELLLPSLCGTRPCDRSACELQNKTEAAQNWHLLAFEGKTQQIK